MDNGKIGIHFVDRLNHGCRNRGRIRRAANHEKRRPSAREIRVECRLGVESKLVHVADDAHDRKPTRLGVKRAKIDALSERISLRPVTPRQVLIDDDVLNLPVAFTEVTARA